MANGNGRLTRSNGSSTPAPAAYFKSLEIENVKCFRGKHQIDLSNGKDKPAQWTVILGNNNTGKTTILKCLAGLEAAPIKFTFSNDDAEAAVADTFAPSMPFKRSSLPYFDELHPNFLLVAKVFHSKVLSKSLLQGEFISLNEKWNLQHRHLLNLNFGLKLENLLVDSFGINRKQSQKSIEDNEDSTRHSNLFENEDLPNIEDWLLNLYLSEKLGQLDARKTLDLASKILISGLLPDVKDLRLQSQKTETGFQNFVEFKTDFGWIRLKELGYGYQSMVAWVLDLVRRMVERYPNSENPLAEPAIVLVDEIDLHLHPDWQRKIIAHLSKYFPNTQFIVTAHSPLVVQSAEEINLVILKRDSGSESVSIEQPKFRTFKGWTVEEILTDLMQLEGQTMSQTYLDLRNQFDTALDEDDFEKAQAAFDALSEILHPSSSTRKLLSLQMSHLAKLESV